MKKTIFSTTLFILFFLIVITGYLSFFGYETDRFNSVIKSEVKKSDKNFSVDFEKIAIFLNIKKLSLFVKFINPEVSYYKVPIQLETLQANLDLESLLRKEAGIKDVSIDTKYININSVRTLINKINQSNLKNFILKNVKESKFKIKSTFKFDENLKLNNNFILNGNIKETKVKFSENHQVENLSFDFVYKKKNINLKNTSLIFKGSNFYDGIVNLNQIKNEYHIYTSIKGKLNNNFLNIPGLNYENIKGDISDIETKFLIKRNNNIFFENISLKNKNNLYDIKKLYLNKNYNLISLESLKIKTSKDNIVNNEFNIKIKKKININGKIFDAKNLLKEFTKYDKKNNFIKNISNDLEVNLDKVFTDTDFPIKNFRLIGTINKGEFQKISAKSDFSDNQHFDISLKNKKNSDLKALEIHSDIATPLLTDYKFFQGLEGGNLIYSSEFSKKNSKNILTINNFKLNKAPALAKLLTLADLKGLTDALKGEGISFDTLVIKYDGNPNKLDITEIFMIGPSISILIDGYVEKKSGLVSLRGTLVPAKTLNNIVSKIPVVGEILIGKKLGEGVFGLSFKIKGLPNNLKTTVNPIKTLTPRFITRALEAAKKKNSKQ